MDHEEAAVQVRSRFPSCFYTGASSTPPLHLVSRSLACTLVHAYSPSGGESLSHISIYSSSGGAGLF